MINGAHVVVYSTDAEADRAFIRNVLRFDHVDVGHGWLIFKLPPAELALHPADANDRHEFYLMTDDLDADMAALAQAGAPCATPEALRWGRMTRFTLPGGGSIGLYQPSHAKP